MGESEIPKKVGQDTSKPKLMTQCFLAFLHIQSSEGKNYKANKSKRPEFCHLFGATRSQHVHAINRYLLKYLLSGLGGPGSIQKTGNSYQ